MDFTKNPVTQDVIVKDTYEKQRKCREKWMMDHGVKYFKYPMENKNFYGYGKSTGTPGPSVTYPGDFSLRYMCGKCCPFSWIENTLESLPPPPMQNMRYPSFEYSKNQRYLKEEHHLPCSPMDSSNRYRTCCPCSPESRYDICADCFYKTFYTT